MESYPYADGSRLAFSLPGTSWGPWTRKGRVILARIERGWKQKHECNNRHYLEHSRHHDRAPETGTLQNREVARRRLFRWILRNNRANRRQAGQGQRYRDHLRHL